MSSNKAKTVLVAGGAGYIGTHTAVELIRAGYDVVIADNLSNSDLSAVKGVEAIVGHPVPFVQVDCCDREAMRQQVFSRYAFDSVIHFAAYKAVGESVAEPLKYFRNNLDSLLTVMALMQEFEVPNLVFSSSATVYGQPEVLPATEQTPRQRANSPYGLTKQMSEDIIQDTVAAVPFFKAIALRYFNPIGAHPSALIGELPKGVPNNLVPFITQTAAGIRKELSVFGDDYDTPDGSCLRDYIDVVDLARAHVVAVDRMVGGRSADRFEIFNIGTGTPVSVLELVRLFEEVNGVPVPHRIAARRPGDVEKIWAATDKANNELGWRAERELGDTLRAAWAWEKHVRGL
ncbi:UDP-glucose 4-epimerase GalE [uncultured Rikenella sp.]|uniref:UDP-glucose 4-epimerase GalE n=1 Tax=uncultured Rikenella sp. TaxID=368003 RepID=UPI0025EEE9BF|nr:UDP-glucose 4-epimerase GalE [uncultured Rikenella sp.]